MSMIELAAVGLVVAVIAVGMLLYVYIQLMAFQTLIDEIDGKLREGGMGDG